jgi:hypothetical protein
LDGFGAGASHLAAGLAVFFVPEMAGAVRRNVHLTSGRGNGNRNHVPQIFRDDISNDEVDLLGGIWRRAFEFDDVAGAVRVPGGLDLDTPESFAGIEDEVVALAVSPSFGYAEAGTGSFGKECGNCGFATRLASREADCVDFQECSGSLGPFKLAGKSAWGGESPLLRRVGPGNCTPSLSLNRT